MAISTKAAKAKGRNLQNHIRDCITNLLKPYGVVAEDVKGTAMGQGGEDVQLSPRARDLLPISVECKAHSRFAIYSVMEQAQANSGGYEPIVFIKADRKKPLVVLDLDYYLNLESERLARNVL